MAPADALALEPSQTEPSLLSDAVLKKAKVTLAMARAQLHKSLKAFGHPPTAPQQAQLVALQAQFESAEKALAQLEAAPVMTVPAPSSGIADLKRAKIQLAMHRAALKKAQTQAHTSAELALLNDAVLRAEQTLDALAPTKS